MIDRRDMLKLVAVGVVGAVVAGSGLASRVVAPVAAGEPMRGNVDGLRACHSVIHSSLLLLEILARLGSRAAATRGASPGS